MLAKQDVEFAYRLLLGKVPENPKLVANTLRDCKNLPALRKRLLQSKQFQKRIGAKPDGNDGQLRRLRAGAPNVEVDVSPEQLDRLFAHVEEVWRKFGETEPHWSVLTNADYRQENLEAHRAAFYASGENAAARLRWALDRIGVPIDSLRTCCELGSGVGRVTIWLARAFEQVIATDISAPHLQVAQAAAAEHSATNVTFHRVATRAEIDALPEFDCFFSVISLQHSPPPVIKTVLAKNLAKLRIGGVAHFQVPTQLLKYEFSVDRFLTGTAVDKDMEHHCLPQPQLFAVLESSGCRLADIIEDKHTGSNKLSNTVTAIKVRPAGLPSTPATARHPAPGRPPQGSPRGRRSTG